MNFDDIRLKQNQPQTKAYNLDTESIDYITSDSIITYLTTDGKIFYFTQFEFFKFDQYVVVSKKIPDYVISYLEYYKSNIEKLDNKLRSFLGIREKNPISYELIDEVYIFNNQINLVHSISSLRIDKQPKFSLESPPKYNTIENGCMIPKIPASGLVPGMQSKILPISNYVFNPESFLNNDLDSSILDIIYWDNIPVYLFGQFEPKIMYDDLTINNHRDLSNISSYLDIFKNIERSFSKLRKNLLHKQLIITDDIHEDIRFLCHSEKYVRLEVFAEKNGQIYSAFIQSEYDFFCLFTLENELNIISNDVWYTNSISNIQYHDDVPFDKLENINDVIDVCFHVAYELMKNAR